MGYHRGATVISLLLPVYNEARYISHLFESLLVQTRPDWEVIVVNDGSTDETVTIAQDYADRDSRIRLIDPGGKPGKVAAFNIAFQESRGDLVCHVGGDDILPPDGLELRIDSLTGARRRSLSLGKLQFIDESGTRFGRPIPRGPSGSQSSPGATYTRTLAELIFPVPLTLPSEDIWLGNAARACSAETRHIQRVVTLYRRHQMNSNPRNKPFDEMSESIARRMRAYQLLLESDLPIPPEYRQLFEHRVTTESLRAAGRTTKLLTHTPTRIIDRLALASMSRSTLWTIRQRAGYAASGWRGR